MVVNNLVDVVEELMINELSGEYNPVDVLLYRTKYVERNNDESLYIASNNVIKELDGTIPKLSESLRVDVFKYFNDMLTNDLNQHLASTVTNIKYLNAREYSQDLVTITNYTEDIKDLLSLSNRSDMLSKSLDSFSTVVDLDESEEEFFSSMFKESTYLPLVYMSRYEAIRVPLLPIVSGLDNGGLYELVDPDVIGIEKALNKTTADKVLLFDSDSNKVYLITKVDDKGRNSKYTIRRIQSDWLTSTTLTE